MDEQLKEYRQHLLLAEQKAQDAYDKAVLSLSGGALAISLAFVDKFPTGHHAATHTGCLLTAWFLWATSLALVLVSHFFSRQALRRSIKQTDANQIYDRKPGGVWAKLTDICNVVAGVTFLVGVGLLISFIYTNMGMITND